MESNFSCGRWEMTVSTARINLCEFKRAGLLYGVGVHVRTRAEQIISLSEIWRKLYIMISNAQTRIIICVCLWKSWSIETHESVVEGCDSAVSVGMSTYVRASLTGRTEVSIAQKYLMRQRPCTVSRKYRVPSEKETLGSFHFRAPSHRVIFKF